MNILICDDDREIVGAIEVYLRNEGYDVFKAYDGIEALDIVRRDEIHLILMDIMMPKLDGMRTTMKIREEKNIPIIMLSAKSEDYDKITGLNVGADDYITKPFNPLELIARVKSQLRRYVNLGSLEKKTGVFKSGGLVVDDEAKTVTVDGEQVPVTPIEFGIVKLLTENAGKVFSMDKIYEAVWNEPSFNPENTVAVHIRRIREKIEINPKDPRYLKVVWVLDIKLKSFSRKRALDSAAFILCVVLFLSSLVGGAFIYNKANMINYGSGVDDVLLFDNYEESAVFQREFDDKLSSVLNLLDYYKSEDYIKSGKTIDDQRMEEALRDLYYNGDAGVSYSYQSSEGVSYQTEGTVSVVAAPYERYRGRDFEESGVQKQFMTDYAAQIEELRKAMIMDDLRAFDSLQKELNKTEGFTYLATDGTYSVSNIGAATTGAVRAVMNVDDFKKAPAYLIYENDNLTKVPAASKGANGSFENFDKRLEANLDNYYNPALKVYLSFDQSFLNAKEAEFTAAKAEVVRWMPMTVACAVASLILLIYLLVATGRKDEEGNYPVHKVDKIFTELKLLAIGILFVGGGVMFGRFALETVNYGISIGDTVYVNSDPLYLSIALASVIGLFSAGFGLYFILSVVRNLKAGKFLKNSVICIVLSALWGGAKEFYYGGTVLRKVVMVTLAICIISATVVLAPVVAVLIIVLAPKWVNKYEAVKKGVEEVKNGNLTYKIKADGEGELDRLARGINEISEASSVAIQNELKNQRLKTDLISNVSHDLKTPLTSIITYIDLLKREGLDSPDALKYLEILDQKSIRLKKLTEDLFDAAKASSGAIPVRFEKVEMMSLINQGLGEMSDRIEASNLEFKISAQNEKYYVRADGQLLWRVLENLLGNVLKYAQEGSRVYIDLREQNGKNGGTHNVILEIKNISKQELNIDADELMERFKRGDESRTTEGSGLGLAIAKDLVRLQNGWFEIKIDGDLFKAVVIMEAFQAE